MKVQIERVDGCEKTGFEFDGYRVCFGVDGLFCCCG